jgi:flagellar motility protein MotE (MotC chaperone)
MKKRLIILIAAGLVSFAGMFAFAWLTKKTPATTKAQQPPSVSQESGQKLPEPKALAMPEAGGTDSQVKRAMTEKQLKGLVHEIREKIQEYDNKLQGLKVREQRLQTAQNELIKDIEELNNLRIELASTIASLKEERDRLDKSRIEIAKNERVNLISIAATYDKMDPASAGKILTNISKPQNGSPNDAVKILHYMSDRTKANLLAELATSEPPLAAYLCQQLKQMVEKK